MEVSINISEVSLTCAGGHKVGTTVNSADLQQLTQIFLFLLKTAAAHQNSVTESRITEFS